MELPVFETILTDGDIGIDAVSFVDMPAIGREFIFFHDTRRSLAPIYLSNDEKREVVSPLLIPGQLIYRENKGHPFYLRWTKPVIRQVAFKYLVEQKHNDVTIMHPRFVDKNLKREDTLIEDVFLKRMWIVEQSKVDPINTEYGFKNLPNGTLCVHYKVENEDLWGRIKSGDLKGLSIEAFMSIVPTKNVEMNKKNIHMNKNTLDVSGKQMSLWNKFVLFLNEISEEAGKIENLANEDITDSGEVKLKYVITDDTYIEVGADGLARDEKGEFVPEGQYLLKDGNILIVGEGNKFAGTVTKEEAKVPAAAVPPIAQSEDLVSFEIAGVSFDLPQPVAAYITELLGKITALEAQVAESGKTAEAFRKEIIQMKSLIPSTKPVPANPQPAAVNQSAAAENHGSGISLAGAVELLNRR